MTNRKTEVKKILKHFGITIPVSYFTDFALELTDGVPSKLYIRRAEDTMRMDTAQFAVESAQRKFTAQLFKREGIKVSYDTFAILHEIGHMLSKQSEKVSDYETEVALLEEMHRKGFLDAEAYITQYNGILDEKNANEWAIAFIKGNPETAKGFDLLVG